MKLYSNKEYMGNLSLHFKLGYSWCVNCTFVLLEVIINSGQNIYTIDKSSQKRPNQHMKYSTVIEELMIKKT